MELKSQEKNNFKNFEATLELGIAISYLVVTTKQNVMMLEHLKNHSWFKGLSLVEKEEYENSLIRAKELAEEISILKH